ncbi:MAG: hypothetical protein JW986_01155 [Methanotrichaceae archaeon]|nr:hypothetical protein [Methanotrichaceae archaeon]
MAPGHLLLDQLRLNCGVLPGPPPASHAPGRPRAGPRHGSALIRSRRAEAGSSLGSWGASSPRKAFFRMDWRSLAARFRLASMAASVFSATERRRSISDTISRCSGVGVIGIR